MTLVTALGAITAAKASEIGFSKEHFSSTLEDAQMRFRAWAAYTAALQKPHLPSSLDVLLKDARDVR
jgi:hypothetical protein